MTSSIATGVTTTGEPRWREETAFFDRAAWRVEMSHLPIDPMALRRHARPVLRSRFNREYRVKVLGPLEGRTLPGVGRPASTCVLHGRPAPSGS